MLIFNKKKLLNKNNVLNTVIILLFIGFFLPLLIHGKDSIIQIHDNLDSFPGWIKMQKENNMFFSLNEVLPSFHGVSNAYISPGYGLYAVIYYLFDFFTAHIILFILRTILGFTSMYLLLKHIFCKSDDKYFPIVKLVSLTYAFLPAISSYWILASSVPLFYYLMLLFSEKKKFDKRVFLVFLYPFISGLFATGVFLLSVWLIFSIIKMFKSKKINLNLIVGFILLVFGYICLELKVFYVMLVLKEPLNRGIFTVERLSFLKATKQTIKESLNWFLSGCGGLDYHYTALQFPFLWFVIIGFFSALLLCMLYSAYKDKNSILTKEQIKYSLMTVGFLSLALFFSMFFGLYRNTYAKDLISGIFHFLKGFNWGRFSFLYVACFYIAFACILVVLYSFKKLKMSVYLLAGIQLVIILTSATEYNYFVDNLFYDRALQNDKVTYNEFFAVDLFDEIKQDINYDGEYVAAVGYHPSVLMYNSFNCLDGYLNIFPYKYMQDFREIIEPELLYNDETRAYFDSWGGRLYLYNDDASFAPTRKKVEGPIVLRINAAAFENLGGKYILSRAEISNYNDLGLTFINHYERDDSIYEIFVYMK